MRRERLKELINPNEIQKTKKMEAYSFANLDKKINEIVAIKIHL